MPRTRTKVRSKFEFDAETARMLAIAADFYADEVIPSQTENHSQHEADLLFAASRHLCGENDEYSAQLERERDALRAQLDWSARHGHVRGERHAEGAAEALSEVCR